MLPNPRSDVDASGNPRKEPGWVCNPDGVLSDGMTSRLNDAITGFTSTQLFRHSDGSQRCGLRLLSRRPRAGAMQME